MSVDSASLPQSFEWEPQPLGAQFVEEILADLCSRSKKLAAFRQRMSEQTGTRLTDWIDHLALTNAEDLTPQLIDAGFSLMPEPGDGKPTWEHKQGMFPRIRTANRLDRLVIKVESIEDFVAAAGRSTGETLPFNWPPPGRLRVVQAFVDGGVEVCAIERHGCSGFKAPEVSTELLQAAEEHLAIFRVRRRGFDDPADGFENTADLIRKAAAALDTDWVCDIFFRSEREYWQSRNKAAQVQYTRQQRFGLGWANHDHHTYRCSREYFRHLVACLELLGMRCRERFYAGREAGWGAQVLEQPECGIVVFADVDLSPEEVTGDFAHEPLPERGELGTVGLWCRLHGEAFLEAGMHHLECQFDFDASRDQLKTASVGTMDPFTDFDYLKQVFTEGEIWKVDPKKVEALRSDGAITDDEAEKFLAEGALGSHLEILERNDGYKGFNQTGINDIILRTDPRN